jgi:chitosanase
MPWQCIRQGIITFIMKSMTKNTILVSLAVGLIMLLGIGGFFMTRNHGGDVLSNDADLFDPAKKEIAMEMVSSAENSSLDWQDQYGYIEWNVEKNDKENRGYTGGLIGFCSGCGDMTQLVEAYDKLAPGNKLQKYLPALRVQELLGMGRVTKEGLGEPFVNDWKAAARDSRFQQAQNEERDRVYFNPAVKQAKTDGLHALGQFAYYDAMVMHGPGDEPLSFGAIRADAMRRATVPSQGGDEKTYLNAYLDARIAVMKAEEGHSDTSRIDDLQRPLLKQGNLYLTPPLHWSVYGDSYSIESVPVTK